MVDYDRFFDTLFEDGASAEDLAEAFNRSVKRDAARKEAEEKAKSKEKLTAARKKIDDALIEYLTLLDPSFAEMNNNEDYHKLMTPFFEEIEREFKRTQKTKENMKKTTKMSDDEIIDNFLKKLFQ